VGRPRDTDRLLQVLRQLDSKASASFTAPLLEGRGAPAAVLFDMDGVLAEVSASYRRAIIETAAVYGVTVTDADISAAKNAGNANNDWLLTHRLVTAGLEERPKKKRKQAAGKHAKSDETITLEQVTKTFQEFYQGTSTRKGLRETEVLIPSKAFLTALAARMPLAVVTGRDKEEAHYFLKEQGIEQHFKAVVCMEDGPSKPDPTVLNLALKRLGVTLNTPSKGTYTIMVGDTPDDITAAVRAESNVIAIGFVPPGCGAPLPLANALYSAGASRVLFDMDQLSEITLGTKFNVYGNPADSQQLIE